MNWWTSWIKNNTRWYGFKTWWTGVVFISISWELPIFSNMKKYKCKTKQILQEKFNISFSYINSKIFQFLSKFALFLHFNLSYLKILATLLFNSIYYFTENQIEPSATFIICANLWNALEAFMCQKNNKCRLCHY